MAKVKVQTKKGNEFGKTIRFGDKDIKFDNLGFAEVGSQEEAESLAMNYKGWLFVGKVPETNQVTTVDDKTNDELQNKIKRLEDSLENKVSVNKAITKEVEDWKAMVEVLKADLAKEKFEFSEYKTQKGKEIEELKLNVGLLKKTTKELVEICVQFNIDEESYKGANKDQLITFILDESRK